MYNIITLVIALRLGSLTVNTDSKEWSAIVDGIPGISREELFDHFGNSYRVVVAPAQKRISVISSGEDGDFGTGDDNLLVELCESDDGNTRVMDKGFD